MEEIDCLNFFSEPEIEYLDYIKIFNEETGDNYEIDTNLVIKGSITVTQDEYGNEISISFLQRSGFNDLVKLLESLSSPESNCLHIKMSNRAHSEIHVKAKYFSISNITNLVGKEYKLTLRADYASVEVNTLFEKTSYYRKL